MCLEGRKDLKDLDHQLVCCCCVLIESSVSFTASQSQNNYQGQFQERKNEEEEKEIYFLPKTVLSEEDVLQLHSIFTETFKTTTEFLALLPSPLPPRDPIIIAIIRVLGAWLAEESLTFGSELYKVLPRLLELCQSLLSQQDEPVDMNPLVFLLPGLSHLVAEDTARNAVKNILPHVIIQFISSIYSNSMR